MELSKAIIEYIAEYLEVRKKVDSIQEKIYNVLSEQGIDTDSIEFGVIIGDLFALGDLESVEQLQTALNNYLRIA